MHQLDRIPVRQDGLLQLRPADDLTVELDDHGPRIEAQLAEQIRHRSRPGNPARLTIHHDLDLAQVSPAQGASMASVAAAGSGACHSARMAATP